jgi:hypothetical protein
LAGAADPQRRCGPIPEYCDHRRRSAHYNACPVLNGEHAAACSPFFAGKRITILVIHCSLAAEYLAENVGEEIGQKFLLFKRFCLGGPEQPGPAGKDFPHSRDIAGHVEGSKVRAQHVGPEQRLGFDGHVAALARRRGERKQKPLS